jgi:hypothetical protein
VTTRSTPKSALDAVAGPPFDLLIADAGFVLMGGLRGFGLARFRETPMIVLGNGDDARACTPFGSQIMFLERPVERAVFICTVTMALMDPVRTPLAAAGIRPFRSVVNGVPSHIIDVSKEGVRLELPRDRRMVTPTFVMRVPLIGVGVSIQRRWVRVPRPEENIGVMWCGGELQRNTVLAVQGWHRFIDTMVSVAPKA